MDNKKRQRAMNTTLIGLTVASLGMFAYQNVYEPHFVQKKEVQVYVANQDIPAFTELTANMFTPVQVEEGSYIKGSVTNLQSVEGKELSGELHSGELLSDTRIATKNMSDGPLIAEVQLGTNIPLKNNDSVRVYVQYQDSNGKTTVQELFHSKKVITKEALLGTAGNVTNGVANLAKSAAAPPSSSSNNGDVVYMRLTDKEAMAYQEAVKTGTLYAVIIADPEAQDTLSPGIVTSTRPMNTTQSNQGSSVASYTVKKGDTTPLIAKKFLTTPQNLAALNNGKTNFQVGDVINVPGN